jgi:hypothetical protein
MNSVRSIFVRVFKSLDDRAHVFQKEPPCKAGKIELCMQ